jgi:hypothetical protein
MTDSLANSKIKDAFETYKNTVFMVETDLRFWQSFIKLSIKDYQSKPSSPEVIFQAIFHAYNINPKTNSGFLKTVKTDYSRKTIDLETQSGDFFIWIMLLSMLKTYNALEILLLQSIQKKYYPSLKDPILSKNACDLIHREIKNNLISNGIKPDLKNNRHLIDFIKTKSSQIKRFLILPIRIDLTTSWENFFELISILRNIIAHHGTIISSDTHNSIKSKAKDLFERHFILKTEMAGYNHIKPIQEQFLNFLNFYNDFSVNVVKLIFNQNDLTFIGIT